MKRLHFLTAVVLLSSAMKAQPPVRLSWSGELNCTYCPLDSVVVTNQSNGEKFVFRYPDTVLVYGNDVGITPIKSEAETSLKTYPNPFSDKVQAEFSLSQSETVDMAVYDVQGREIVRQQSILEKGTHRFNLRLPYGMYILHLQTAAGSQSVRLLSENNETTTPQIVYAGTVPIMADIPKKVRKANDGFPFKYGDTLVMQGFVSDSGVFQYKEEHIITLTEDTHVTFAFFDELAFVDTSGIIIIDSLLYSKDSPYGIPCYYYPIYQPELYDYHGKFTIINTQSDLDSLFACDNSLVPPVIDFSCQSLILVCGISPNVISGAKYISFSFIKNCNGDYVIKMDIGYGALTAEDEFYWTVVVNEVIENKEEVKLIIKYK